MNLPCPRCQVPLHHRSNERFATAFCATCGGLFISSKSEDAIDAAGSRESIELAKMLDSHSTHNSAKENAPAPCPMCAKIMEHTHVGALVIDRCRAHGAWYDKSELQKVVEILASRQSSAEQSREFDAEASGLELAHPPNGRSSRNAPQRREPSANYAAARAIAGAQAETDRRQRRIENVQKVLMWGDLDDVGFLGDILGGLFSVLD